MLILTDGISVVSDLIFRLSAKSVSQHLVLSVTANQRQVGGKSALLGSFFYGNQEALGTSTPSAHQVVSFFHFKVKDALKV